MTQHRPPGRSRQGEPSTRRPRARRHTTTVIRHELATGARERTRDGFVSRERARERRLAMQVRERRDARDDECMGLNDSKRMPNATRAFGPWTRG